MITETKQQSKKEQRKAWVEALRSGKYKQGQGFLKCDDSFCCLGVLQLISGAFIPSNAIHVDPDVRDKIGLSTSSGRFYIDGEEKHLSNLNDSGVSFHDIADIIESEPEGLFTS